MTQTREQALNTFVRMNVHYCVSSLVSTLANAGDFRMSDRIGPSDGGQGKRDLIDLCEHAAELCSPVEDFEEAATQAGWRHGGDFDGFWCDGNAFESWKAAASSDDASTYATPEELCEMQSIEPYQWEIFEHWIVSDWLAEKLEAEGERINRDFAGLTIRIYDAGQCA